MSTRRTLRLRIQIRLGIAIVCGVALLLSACASEESESESTSGPPSSPALSDADEASAATTTTTATATATATAEPATQAKPAAGASSQLIELLSVAPYQGSFGYVDMVNVNRLFEAGGSDHDDACSVNSGEEFWQLYNSVTGRAALTNTNVPMLIFNAPQTFEELPIAFGFAHCEIDSYLHFWGTSYFVWVDKDGSDVAEQAAQDPTWSESVTLSTSDDFTVVDWGAVLDPDRMTALRTEGGKLVISDHVVARVTRSEDVELILDPSAERMIDRPHIRRIVEQLEARGVHSIVLAERPFNSGISYDQRLATRPDDLDEETWDLIAAGPRLEPWMTMGYGSAASGQHGDIAVVVIAHATAEDAQANMARLTEVVATGLSSRNGTAWSERLSLVEIQTDDVLVIATLVSADANHPFATVDAAHGIEDNLLSFDSDSLE